jgi:hypothetical protein
MMYIEDFLPLLKPYGIKRTGPHWTARCPAHDDRKPSLSVAYGEGGRILLKCHAGCPTENIVKALGVKLSDLFQDGHTPARSSDKPVSTPGSSSQTFERLEDAVAFLSRQFGCEPSGDWGYFGADGRLVGGVCRWDVNGRKEIRPFRRLPDDRWVIAALPEPRPLYNFLLLRKAEASVPIIVVEGEKAAEAVGPGLPHRRSSAAGGMGSVAGESAGGRSDPTASSLGTHRPGPESPQRRRGLAPGPAQARPPADGAGAD